MEEIKRGISTVAVFSKNTLIKNIFKIKILSSKAYRPIKGQLRIDHATISDGGDYVCYSNRQEKRFKVSVTTKGVPKIPATGPFLFYFSSSFQKLIENISTLCKLVPLTLLHVEMVSVYRRRRFVMANMIALMEAMRTRVEVFFTNFLEFLTISWLVIIF